MFCVRSTINVYASFFVKKSNLSSNIIVNKCNVGNRWKINLTFESIKYQSNFRILWYECYVNVI